VVFRIPQSRVAEAINCLSEFGGGLERGDAGASLDERNEVERRERESFAIRLFE
jgi:hypothetical protein